MKTLAELLAALPQQPNIPAEAHTIKIKGITRDSRRVQPGWLFVAYKGVEADGHTYIPDALRRGAAAIVCETARNQQPTTNNQQPTTNQPPAASHQPPILVVQNGREALAWLCAAWHDFPGRSLTMIGVTGTDGKTTTTNLIFNILKAAGIKAGMISTVNAVIGERVLDTGLHTTTPDADEVQDYLAQMRDAGLTHCVLEVTSHGLAHHRVDAADFDVAVVTNITHEHLDLHGSREAYRAAKARLFEMTTSAAVLNADDEYSFEYLRAIPVERQIIYTARADGASSLPSSARVLAATNVVHAPDSLSFSVEGMTIRSALISDYNVSNILAAIGAATALNVPQDAIVRGIAALAGVPGRMERISAGQDFLAIVDFAHTPNALENALRAARRITSGRLIAVFGCAGERDRQKRPMMARAAAQLADIAVFTAEDPRRESLDDIFAQMDAGVAELPAEQRRAHIHHVKDRGEAIALACSLARKGDTVIACGKGHEQSMCFGTTEYPWDDREAMRVELERSKVQRFERSNL